jgi:hypothetical protein
MSTTTHREVADLLVSFGGRGDLALIPQATILSRGPLSRCRIPSSLEQEMRATRPSVGFVVALMLLCGVARGDSFDTDAYDIWRVMQSRTNLIDKFHRTHNDVESWGTLMRSYSAMTLAQARTMLAVAPPTLWYTRPRWIQAELAGSGAVLVILALADWFPSRLRFYLLLMSICFSVAAFAWPSFGWEGVRLASDEEEEAVAPADAHAAEAEEDQLGDEDIHARAEALGSRPVNVATSAPPAVLPTAPTVNGREMLADFLHERRPPGEWISTTAAAQVPSLHAGGLPAPNSFTALSAVQRAVTEIGAKRTWCLTWGSELWRTVAAIDMQYGLAPELRMLVASHGYHGGDSSTAPRYDELVAGLSALAARGNLAMPATGGTLTPPPGLATQSDDIDFGRWSNALPPSLPRAALEIYGNLRAAGHANVREYLNAQQGLKSRAEWGEWWASAVIADQLISGARSNRDLTALLSSSDTLEIILRKLAAVIYEVRTGDKAGALHIAAVVPPNVRKDIAPTWLISTAAQFSQAEFKTQLRVRGLEKPDNGPRARGRGGGRSDGATAPQEGDGAALTARGRGGRGRGRGRGGR